MAMCQASEPTVFGTYGKGITSVAEANSPPFSAKGGRSLLSTKTVKTFNVKQKTHACTYINRFLRRLLFFRL